MTNMGETLDVGIIEQFESRLRAEEKSRATIEKYKRDVKTSFVLWGRKQTADKGHRALL